MGRGVARRDPTHVTLKVKLCMHIMFQVSSSQGLCWPKYHFWWVFLGPYMKTEMGVVIYMYSKHSSDYIDSKYICIKRSTP